MMCSPDSGLGLSDMTFRQQYMQSSDALSRSCMSSLHAIPHIPSALGKLSMWPTYGGRRSHAHSKRFGTGADDLALSAEMPSAG